MKVELHATTAVVLAGGLGTRVRHLLPDLPKPMVPVAGRPFLEWIVRFLAREGVRHVVISTGYMAQIVERHFRALAIPDVNIACAAEPEPLGTAGGFLHAVRSLDDRPETWLVVNGDTLLLTGLAKVASCLADGALAGVIVAVRVPDCRRYGTLAWSPCGDLLGWDEKKQGEGVVNGGMYMLRDSLVRQFPSRVPLSLETEVLPALASQGVRIRVSITDAPFLDIGTAASLRQAEPFIQQNLGTFWRS